MILQNEALNGGGKLFVEKLPNLKVRVVHGNTLTAAVILNEIPEDVDEVFMTGATSKLGRAIALYLARRKVRVLVCFLIKFECFIMFSNNLVIHKVTWIMFYPSNRPRKPYIFIRQLEMPQIG